MINLVQELYPKRKDKLLAVADIGDRIEGRFFYNEQEYAIEKEKGVFNLCKVAPIVDKGNPQLMKITVLKKRRF